MGFKLAAVAAVLLASPALSAQPARRVTQLALNDAEECTAVSAPLLRRVATGRRGTTLALGVLAMFADSAAAGPLSAVVINAWAEQPFGDDAELIAARELRLRVDGGPPRIYHYRSGRSMHSRRENRQAESAYYKIPRADLERMARARTVTGSVSAFSFTLGPEQMATLREFALYAARSPRAPVPRPGGPLQVDCDSYQTIVR
jgi:hypothetical protein